MALLFAYEILAKDIKYKSLLNPEQISSLLNSERKLALKYKVSRNTVRAALMDLQNEGFLVKKESKLIINPYKKDFLTSSFLEENNMNSKLEYQVMEYHEKESDKNQSLRLQIPLGTVFISVLYRYRPIEQSSFIGTVYFEAALPILKVDLIKKHESPLRILIHSSHSKVDRENQHISIETPSKRDMHMLATNNLNNIIVRKSQLVLKNEQCIFVLNRINPKYARITTKNQIIEKKVGYFIEWFYEWTFI